MQPKSGGGGSPPAWEELHPSRAGTDGRGRWYRSDLLLRGMLEALRHSETVVLHVHPVLGLLAALGLLHPAGQLRVLGLHLLGERRQRLQIDAEAVGRLDGLQQA